jgi:hypothetical protein
MLRDMISRNAVTEYDGELFCEIADEHLCCEKALVKDEAIAKLREALERISTTPYRIYDGNRPFISDHDSGYAQGIAAGHQLAAMWAEKALAETEQVDDGWMPIKSCKEKGKIILGVWSKGVWYQIMGKKNTKWGPTNIPVGFRNFEIATHWMPLPPPPKEI